MACNAPRGASDTPKGRPGTRSAVAATALAVGSRHLRRGQAGHRRQQDFICRHQVFHGKPHLRARGRKNHLPGQILASLPTFLIRRFPGSSGPPGCSSFFWLPGSRRCPEYSQTNRISFAAPTNRQGDIYPRGDSAGNIRTCRIMIVPCLIRHS